MPKPEGSCPQCGAPIYCNPPTQESPNPVARYTCHCRLGAGVEFVMPSFQPRAACVHCYCIYDSAGTRCCKCGDHAHGGVTTIRYPNTMWVGDHNSYVGPTDRTVRFT